ncbi:glycosyltransferase [Cyanobium sp. Morenito 9A2]|uniref:glycosyltransferase n=1 Tax=Cyanobium sp. Morenito 9A2 TaxID=2823718 RepID=UPI0037BE338B
MGLYLLHLHLHGLFRGCDLELGRDADTGGQTTYVLELAQALAAHSEVEQLEVVTRLIDDRRLSADYARPIEALAPGASILRFPCGPKRYLRKELLWPHLDQLADTLVAHLGSGARHPDWIHAHYADAGYVGALVSRRLGIPLVYTGHSLGREKLRRLLANGADHAQMEKLYAISRRIEAEELALAQSLLVVTSTRQEADHQYGRYGHYQPGRAEVIPPGVDRDRFHPGGPRRRPGLGLPRAVAVPDAGRATDAEAEVEELLRPFLREPERPPLLTICRADRRKNILALIEAFGSSPVLRERHNLVLVLGCRQDPRHLEKQQRDLFQQVFELIDRFDLYGLVAYPKRHGSVHIPHLYRWAAQRRGVFVNPALTEPFGLTLLESAASGLPVVATDDGGPREIVARCRNGLLVDVSDLQGLRKALELAMADPVRWHRWRDQGLEAVGLEFSWEAHVGAYLAAVLRRCGLATSAAVILAPRPGGARRSPPPQDSRASERWLLAPVGRMVGVQIGHPVAEVVVPEGLTRQPRAGQLGGAQGTQQAAKLPR